MQTASQIGRQAAKEYVLHPLLSGKGWRRTITGNLTANVIRNVWSHSVIMCGHFPEGVETFEKAALPEKETRGSGTCARCSARPTSPGPRPCTS